MFHKKEINELNKEVKRLKEELDSIKIFMDFEKETTKERINAILNYLDIAFTWEEVEDPNYIKREPPKISVLKAITKKEKQRLQQEELESYYTDER